MDWPDLPLDELGLGKELLYVEVVNTLKMCYYCNISDSLGILFLSYNLIELFSNNKINL